MNRSAKGKRFEQDVADKFRKAGYSAHRVRLSGQGLGENDVVVQMDRERVIQCKKRADGRKIGWPSVRKLTEDADFVVIGEDRKASLVVLPLETFLEMVKP